MTKAFLLATASAVALSMAFASVAAADDAKIIERIDAMQKQLEQQQAEIAAQKAEIARLRASVKPGKGKAAKVEEPVPEPVVQDVATKAEVNELRLQVAEQNNRSKLERQEQPLWSVANLRPTIQSPDGRFTMSLRGQFQLDMANYFQDEPGAPNVDFRRGSQGAGNREVNSARELSDGVNFRRAQIGVEGKFWRDFNYRIVYEFGGSGTEGPARINDAYVNYTGFAPFTFQVGAFLPNSNMDDATSATDILFMERATAAELSRSLAGADGRYGAGVKGNGERWLVSLYWTGGTVGDAENAGEQGSLVGRVAGLLLSDADYNLHVGANGSWVFEPPDQGSLVTSGRYPIRFRDRPELRVDSTRLIDTGTIDADSAYAAGLEAAGNWKSFFFQGEYFKCGIDRRLNPIADDPEFSGWYAQASWILSGETHRYSMASASYSSPKPMVPVSADGGFGAIELAGRFSHVDLDFHEGFAGTAAPVGSIRGGQEDIWTLGVNWYLNANLRMSLNYFMVDVDRLNPAGPGNLTPFGAAPSTPPNGVQIGQDYDAIALRTQFAF
jgi:phosphate-selective porin OprO/OprP